MFALSQPKEGLGFYFNKITVTTFVTGYRDFPAGKRMATKLYPWAGFFRQPEPCSGCFGVLYNILVSVNTGPEKFS